MSIWTGIQKQVPASAGVYFFRRGRTAIYIGKAANLKKRLSSYFRKNVSDKVRQLREEATLLDWIITSSEQEALVQETMAIKSHVPKFNVLMRDDKSFFFVKITREKFPRIFLTHEPRGQANASKSRYIGPFTSGRSLKSVLKHLRRLFPYCTCKKPHRRACLNSQIGNCLGYCCSIMPQNARNPKNEEYGQNIKNIIAVLSGKREQLLRSLRRHMRRAARSQDFEQAAQLRDTLWGLENVFAHRSVLEQDGSLSRSGAAHMRWPKTERSIRVLLGIEQKIIRVEGYDISNISGASATGSMVVFINGMPDKSKYRKFKIKTVHQASDVDMHKEVIRRRLQHAEWKFPDIMVIDGGRPQLNAVKKELRITNTSELRIKIVALAKREEELYIEGKAMPVRLDSLPQDVMHFFQHVRDESHRFAKKYHHKLREISYRDQASKT